MGMTGHVVSLRGYDLFFEWLNLLCDVNERHNLS